MKWKKIITILMAMIIVGMALGVATAYDFDPGRDINLRDRYDIKNAVDIETACINLSGDYRCAWFLDPSGVPIHNELSELQGGTTNQYYHLNQSEYGELSSKIFSWITSGFFDQDLNTTDSVTFANITADNITAGYYSGQPIDGSIGSGIINSSSNKEKCACINASDMGGLDVWYPDLKVRIWSFGETTYCDVSSDTVTVLDDAHQVYYVDSSCSVSNMSWVNYFAQDLNPADYARIFDAYAKNGDIEVVKGSSIIGMVDRKTKWVNVNCGEGGHLSICEGIDVEENTFPDFNQTAGTYNYVHTVHTSAAKQASVDGIHITVASDGSHTAETGINLSACDGGSGPVVCSDNKYRRYVIYTIGFGIEHTKIHQLAPLDGVTYKNIGECADLGGNPFSYTLPDEEYGVATLHHIYCGRRDDSSWNGAWLDIRGDIISAGPAIDTSIFLTIDGARPLTDNWDAGAFNITAHWFKGLFNWTEDSIYLTFDGSTLSFSESQLNNTIDARAGTYSAGGDYLYLNASDYFFLNETALNTTIDSRAGQIYFADEKFINLNESNYFIFNETYLNETGDVRWIQKSDEGDLNVNSSNSSDFWDGYDTPADITVGNASLLDGYDSLFFMPLNTSPVGNFSFNGGWESGGLTISGGDIYAQVGYFYNITSLNVTKQDLTIIEDLTVLGDFAADSSVDTFYVNSTSNKVGVGTTNPPVKFTVQDGNILVERTDATNAILRLRNTNDENQIYTEATTGDLRFYNDAVLMTIEPDGDIGIGTTAPSHKLTVQDTSTTSMNVSDTLFVDGSNKRINIGIASPTAVAKVVVAGDMKFEKGGSTGFGTADYQDLGIVTNDTVRIKILKGGNIGIGTISPERTLHIIGSDGEVGTFPASLGGKDFLIMENNDSSNMAFVSKVDGASAIKFYEDGVAGFEGGIQYNHLTDKLQFGTSGSINKLNIDSTGNVGIGTASPATKFHVESTRGTAADRVRFNLTDDINNATLEFMGHTGGVNHAQITTNDDDSRMTVMAAVGTASAPRFQLIGPNDTAAPEARGNAIVDYGSGDYDLSATSSFKIRHTNPTANYDMLNVYGGGLGADAGSIVFNEESKDIDFRVESDDDENAFFVQGDTGNVGIGTTSPSELLEISGGIILLDNNQWYSAKDSAGTSYGILKIKSDNNTHLNAINNKEIRFTIGANDYKMTILDSGNVGIGTENPERLLHLVNSAPVIQFNDTDSSVGWRAGQKGDNFDITEVGVSTWLHIADTTGYVGIGTDSPDRKLHVNSTDAVQALFRGTNALGSYLDIDTGAVDKDAVVRFQENGSSKWMVGVDGNDSDKFKIGWVGFPNTRLTIDSSGNVGIGTTSPEQLLHLKKDAFALEYFDRTANAGVSNIYQIAIGSTDYMQIGVVGTRQLILDDDGKVGIGVINPAEKLEVNGTVLLDTDSDTNYAIKFNADRDATTESLGNIVSFWDNTAVARIRFTAGADAANKDDGRIYLQTSTGGGAFNNGIILRESGNVGIGTTSPDHNLVVEATAPVIEMASTFGGDQPVGVFEFSNATGSPWARFALEDEIFIIGGYHPKVSLYFQTDATTRMFIDNATGYVGIGTTTPSSSLHISSPSYQDHILIDRGGNGSYITQSAFSTLIEAYGSTNALDIFGGVMEIGTDGKVGIGTTNPGYRLDIPNSSASHNFGTPLINLGYDGGLGASEGNIKIGNYQLFVSASETATYDDASQALVIQTEDNPDATGFYQLLSVQSSGNANRFSVIHGSAGFASQFYDSLAIGTSGYTNCSVFADVVDCGISGNADLWVADDVEIEDDLFVGGLIYGNGSQLTGLTLTESDPYWTGNFSAKTGTGNVVFSTSPTFTTGITVPADSISDDELNEGLTFEWTGVHTFAATGTFNDDLIFADEIKPDNEVCANDDILVKVGADDWGCRSCAEITGSADLCDGSDAGETGAEFGDYKVMSEAAYSTSSSVYTHLSTPGKNLTLSLPASGFSTIECNFITSSGASTTGIQFRFNVTGGLARAFSQTYIDSSNLAQHCSGFATSVTCNPTSSGSTAATDRVLTQVLFASSRISAGQFDVELKSETGTEVWVSAGSFCRVKTL